MPGEIPFYIVGTVATLLPGFGVAYVKVLNGNVYHLHPDTPGVDFSKLYIGQIVELEITSMLTRVLSATLIN